MESKQEDTLQYSNQAEKIEALITAPPVDLSPLLGTWRNTNVATGNIIKAVFSLDGNDLKIRLFGAASPVYDLGETACQAFVDTIDSEIVTGLTANYDFSFKKLQIAGNIKQGILVLQVYNLFTDNSGRANYFSREFYHRIEE